MTDESKLNALFIDPDERTVKALRLLPDTVPDLLRSQRIGTIDLRAGQCIVVDDSEHDTEHPARFRFTDDALARPFFGPALVLGSEHGNWISTEEKADDVRVRIIWEHWDNTSSRYVSPTDKRV